MSLLEILTLSLGSAGFILSVISLILGKKWSNRAWERDSRVPFYAELGVFMNEVLEDMVVGHLRMVRKRLDFAKYISQARSLSLNEIASELQRLSSASTKYRNKTSSDENLSREIENCLVKIRELSNSNLKRIHKQHGVH